MDFYDINNMKYLKKIDDRTQTIYGNYVKKEWAISLKAVGISKYCLYESEFIFKPENISNFCTSVENYIESLDGDYPSCENGKFLVPIEHDNFFEFNEGLHDLELAFYEDLECCFCEGQKYHYNIIPIKNTSVYAYYHPGCLKQMVEELKELDNNPSSIVSKIL